MAIRVVEAPVSAISVAEARAHLRVEAPDDEAIISAMIAAAQGSIDGPDGWLGRSIGKQTLRATDLEWPVSGLQLPYGPVQSVQSVTLGGVPVDGFTLGDDGLLRASGWPWWTPGGPVITYVAGYEANMIPAPIKMALLLMVQDLYGKRSRDPSLTVDTVIGVQSQQFDAGGSTILGDTAKALLAPFRMWSL